MMEKKCKNKDSPVLMKARTRRCGDDAPATRSFAGSFSAIIQNSRLVYGLVTANYRVLKLPRMFVLDNNRLQRTIRGWAYRTSYDRKTETLHFASEAREFVCQNYISHIHCWNFTKKTTSAQLLMRL